MNLYMTKHKRSLVNEIRLIMKGYQIIWNTGGKNAIIYQLFESVFSSLFPFIHIYFSARIVDAIVDRSEVSVVIYLASIAVVLNFSVQIITKICTRNGEIWKQNFNHYYKMLYPDKLMKMEYRDVEDTGIQSIRSKIEEIKNLSGRGIKFLLAQIDPFAKSVVQIAAAFSLSITFFTLKTTDGSSLAKFLDSPVALFLVFGFGAVFLSLSSMLTKKEAGSIGEANEMSLLANRMIRFYNVNITNDINTGKDIRLYNLSEMLSEDFKGFIKIFEKSLNHYFKFFAKSAMAKGLIIPVITCIAYILVALKSICGAYGIGSIIQYVGAISQMGIGILLLINCISGLIGNNEHLLLIMNYMNIPNQKSNNNQLSIDIGNDEIMIEFRKVSFKYPNAEKNVIENLNLKIMSGKSFAIVGVNGSGKTTMIKLLCRLYDPTEGEILLNGINIKDYKYEEYLSLFAVVFQDFKLPALPLGQNIAVREQYDKTEIINTLYEAGFNDLIHQEYDALDAYLYKDYDESGINISGGEAQKIAIARAICKKAPFMVLDEPTSALDPISEMELYEKFNSVVSGKTAIYISHRLTSCRFCDNIIVFDKGKIIQEGRHNELVSDTRGKYYELWQAQAQYYQ